MEQTVFLFSGQGAQYPGMGRELCENFPEAARVFEQASEVFGTDLLRLAQESGAEELSQTGVSQPLTYTLSMAAHAVLTAEGVAPAAVAGFSLGECSALTAAGGMSLDTGLRVIRARAAAMQRAAEVSHGAMYAIIGPDAPIVEAACADAPGYAAAVNYNCPGQIVIAGEAAAAEAAAQTLRDAGARVVKLAVNAAFHSRLMAGAAEEFYEAVKNGDFHPLSVPMYSNVTGELLPASEDIPSYLKTQMVSSVRFTDELAAMGRDGYARFAELGPGKTLCGFVRKGLRGARFLNVQDAETARAALSALK